VNPISPKVSAAVLAGIFVSAILGNLSTVDPSMLAWFGPWSPFIYGTAVSLLSGLAGYWARDPYRDLGIVHAAAGTAYPDTPIAPKHAAEPGA